MIYTQGTHTEQLEYKLTTQNLSWIFQTQNSRASKYVICSAANTSYYALSEDQFITYSVFSIKRRKTYYVTEQHSTTVNSQVLLFSIF